MTFLFLRASEIIMTLPMMGGLPKPYGQLPSDAGRGSLRRLQVTGKRTPDRRTNETDDNVYRAKCPERSSL